MSFYQDAAATVTRLLSTYGFEASFYRPGAVDPVTGVKSDDELVGTYKAIRTSVDVEFWPGNLVTMAEHQLVVDGEVKAGYLWEGKPVLMAKPMAPDNSTLLATKVLVGG
tara:strand:- start:14841 stop:15170 length:330 start_codon:yes stop_codon:yes gene_type:complete